jgi:hypothetical protein
MNKNVDSNARHERRFNFWLGNCMFEFAFSPSRYHIVDQHGYRNQIPLALLRVQGGPGVAYRAVALWFMVSVGVLRQISTKNLVDIEFGGIDHRDYPDYCDAFLSAASERMPDGSLRDLSDDELVDVQESNPSWFHEQLWRHLH